MKQFDIFFIYLQEHWLPHNEAHKTLTNDFAKFNFLTTSSDMFEDPEDLALQSGPTWHGTAIGWPLEANNHITKLPIVSTRFCGVSYQDENSSINILSYSVYFPTSGRDEEFLEVIDVLTKDIHSNLKKDSSILIGADTNQSEKSTGRRKEAMRRFLDEFSLKSVLLDSRPTFHHNNQISETQIDHILYYVPQEKQMKVNFKDHICQKLESDNLSAHDVIVGDISIVQSTSKQAEVDYSETYTEFRVKKPKWDKDNVENYQEQTARILSELVDKFDQPEEIPILTEMFARTLVLSAEQNFETTNPNKPRKPKNFPSFSKELDEAYKNHKKVCQAWRSAGRPIDNSHPAKMNKLESQRMMRRIARENESEKACKLHDELMEVHFNDISRVCQKLKKIRGENYEQSKIPSIETLNGTFTGSNVLEGFRVNTEVLCNEKKDIPESENTFLKMCEEDNMTILKLIPEENVQIPLMTIECLKDILFRKLKLGKACDIYKLTVEHLRYAGDETLSCVVTLLNEIIKHINYLSSEQLNTSIASIIHKGKDKPITHHKSYRQVRVTVLFGRLLDEYTRPRFISMARPLQNINQYGFTENITYLMAALQRHECEKFCIDMKKTFLGCSLDGESAFEVVNRDIQKRELYMAGESGQYWLASHYSYLNSETRIKMNGQLSRPFKETLGVKQGHVRSSDNYKVYINPLLDTLEESQLGIWIGPVNVSSSDCADDVYLISDDQTRLQCLLDIASHYGQRYRVKYGATKTKITVVGAEIDKEYFADVKPWKMDGETVQIVEDNEHLGQIVSDIRAEAKNVDLRLRKGRGMLFSLLGPAFAYKCLLSPIVKLHFYRTFVCPILRSGLSSFALREETQEPLAIFHRKTLRSILKLSKTAANCALYFLCGELPIVGKIHRDLFSLFYSVWNNPDTKIYQVVKYLLSSACDNSRTWSVFLKHLSLRYELDEPSKCLLKDPPKKSEYKELILTKITAYYERKLRADAEGNSCLDYLNVSVTGLRGRRHPAISGLITTEEVKTSRCHLKMLCGDYLTYKKKSDQSGGSPHCRVCGDPNTSEDISHILTSCSAYDEVRNKKLEEIELLCNSNEPKVNFASILGEKKSLCQFILDPTSLNLGERINPSDKNLNNFFKVSRSYCHVVNTARLKILKSKSTKKP